MRLLLLLLFVLPLAAADGPRQGTTPYWGIMFLPTTTGDEVAVMPIPGSPAAHHGLKDGDVILRFNGTDIDSRITLIRLLAALTWENPRITATIRRGQEEQEIKSFLVWVRDIKDLDEWKLVIAEAEKRLGIGRTE